MWVTHLCSSQRGIVTVVSNKAILRFNYVTNRNYCGEVYIKDRKQQKKKRHLTVAFVLPRTLTKGYEAGTQTIANNTSNINNLGRNSCLAQVQHNSLLISTSKKSSEINVLIVLHILDHLHHHHY